VAKWSLERALLLHAPTRSNSRLSKTLKPALGPFDSSASTQRLKLTPRLIQDPTRTLCQYVGQKVGLTVQSLESNSATQKGQPTSCECSRSLNKPFEFPEPHPLIYTVIINRWTSSRLHHSMTISGLHRHSRFIQGSVGED